MLPAVWGHSTVMHKSWSQFHTVETSWQVSGLNFYHVIVALLMPVEWWQFLEAVPYLFFEHLSVFSMTLVAQNFKLFYLLYVIAPPLSCRIKEFKERGKKITVSTNSFPHQLL